MSLSLKGAESEAMFAYVSLKQKWEISEPVHHSPYAYDFVIRRHSKKWETVQVKTAWAAKTKSNKKEIRITLRKTNGKGKVSKYEMGDFDLLCVIYYDDMWLIPWNQIQSQTTVVVSCEKYDGYKVDTNRGIKPKTTILRNKNVKLKNVKIKGVKPRK